jgi:hypothetical protein
MLLAIMGLVTGSFMLFTMQFRMILYPIGGLGLIAAYWMFFRLRKDCAAKDCPMKYKRLNIAALVSSTLLMAIVTYVDFFLVSM